MKQSRSGMRWVTLTLMILAAVVITGCEWEGTGEDDHWSERYAFLNVSGIYRPAQGTTIVHSFETPRVVDQATGTGTVDNQQIGTGDGVSTTYSGVLGSSPVVSGSLSITAGGFQLVDLGNGLLGGSGVSGTINYGTGAWAIDLGGAPINVGVPIIASYQFTMVPGGSVDDSVPPGSSQPIYQFNVEQTGNRVTLTDNYGNTYAGKLAPLNTVNEGQLSQQRQQINQSIPLTAEGVSGMRVRIVGAFLVQQTIFYTRNPETGAQTESHRLISFLLDGTWIEPSGRTGRIEAIGPADQRIQVETVAAGQ